jgi:hypothetical protein
LQLILFEKQNPLRLETPLFTASMTMTYNHALMYLYAAPIPTPRRHRTSCFVRARGCVAPAVRH